MIKAARFPEAHRDRYLLPSDYPAINLDTWITNLIGDFRDEADPIHLGAGQALFAEYGAGVALTHAHPVDQWQIYVAGSAHLAKKPVQLVTVQYSDRWVPYGPIEVHPDGFALLALWPRPNALTYEMPKDADLIREHLRDKPHRMMLAQLEIADTAPTAASTAMVLAVEPRIWARQWRLPAGTSVDTPDPSQGGGQFFIPLWGTMVYEEREYPRWSSVYVGPQDGPITLHAGADGATILGTQFAPQ